jgi:TolB-like protein
VSALLDRLKERKIVQWAIGYLATAYALLEGFDLLSDPFGDANAIKRVLVALFVFGFFITLVLAWFHAEKGKQRVTAVEIVILMVLLVGSIPTAIVSYRLDSGAALAMDAGIESVLTGPVVAVLPFENLSAGEEGAKHIVDGIHAEILANLSGLTGLNAISRTSVLGYERAGKTMRQIAEDLGASAVLEGQIQKVGDALRITVNLIDGLTDTPIWAEVYPRMMEASTVFAVQGEIAAAIADALAVTLAPAQQSRLSHVATRDREALELYMLGQEAEDRAERGEFDFFQEAAGYYQQALERDPEYADAQAAHGRMIFKVYWRVPRTPRTPEIADSVLAAAERAIQLDPELAAGHLLLGNYYGWNVGDATRATESYVRARQLDPDNVATLTALARMNMSAGDFEAARTNLYRAAQLDPRDGDSQRLAYSVAYYMRRWDDAELHFARAVRRFVPDWETADKLPNNSGATEMAYGHLIGFYLAVDGNTDRAHAALMEMLDRMEPPVPSLRASIFLEDAGFSPVNIGPTMLSMQEVQDFFQADPEFPRPFEIHTRAMMLRLSGEDPVEEQRLWGLAGDRNTDDEYGGRHTGDEQRRVYFEAGSEIEARSQSALLFARGGRQEDARVEMARAMEISAARPYAELTLNAEPRWAMTYVELGEHETALDMLEEMMSRPAAISVGLLTVQPEWDPIRENPRFQALLEGG